MLSEVSHTPLEQSGSRVQSGNDGEDGLATGLEIEYILILPTHQDQCHSDQILEEKNHTYRFPPPQNLLGSAGQGALHELSAALTAVLSME